MFILGLFREGGSMARDERQPVSWVLLDSAIGFQGGFATEAEARQALRNWRKFQKHYRRKRDPLAFGRAWVARWPWGFIVPLKPKPAWPLEAS
jgi:hypothetical protein